ncbi:MAG: sodium:solute symporter family protein [Phycisphaerae bacterium]|nr:sodium:solute symporter family protein [Phycisphaerae bacterium]
MIYFFSILAYLLLLGCIGAWKSRQVKTEEDFAVAGRTLSPWIMVCTMLAVWIGTGSIVGNAERTYKDGMAALILPAGTFIGMILLSMIAAKARRIEASSVPEIIGGRFGQTARALSVVSLIVAYMVIVSYQFNAGGAVLEVITGKKPSVNLAVGDTVTARQLVRGWVIYTPPADWTGEAVIAMQGDDDGEAVYRVEVVASEEIGKAKERLEDKTRTVAIRRDNYKRVLYDDAGLSEGHYRIASFAGEGTLVLEEPRLTKEIATVIAAVFIILFTMLAGLMSLAYADIVTGIVITTAMLITLPVYWVMAGGIAGMTEAFSAMGDRPQHMQFWGVYSPVTIINFCLPVFLLVLGDANQYQRIFASRSAKGAKAAVTTMIFLALAIELLIIASAWTAGSMTPDPENGKYILIYAARHYLPLPLGCLFMVTVVGIIVSTANSFLLVPATTFIKDVYLNHINPKANAKRTIFISRFMVVVFGVVAYIVSRAFAESTGFFEKALYAFTIYGASITPSLVAAIVWPRATKAGAISSILSGTVIALVWSEADFIHARLPEAVSGLDAVLPAITVSVICLVVVSLLTKNPQQNKVID